MRSTYRFLVPLILLSTQLAGCQTAKPSPIAPVIAPVLKPASERYIPVQRQGRYTLVELTPEAAKLDLLLQVIDIDIPSAWVISVEEAMHYVLLRTGFRLCERTSANAALFVLPLPAAHLKLGPIVLREALQMLAGPAWALHANEQGRQVCFVPAQADEPEAAVQLTTEPSETIQ
ncbi:PilL N-terminal domain-containing protein [Pseudomonas koreensis]|uniref:PilL N-terminal domain-containing protein n=1 Tax=Pseudomonas koreensis TaxID=198620 RepID=A0A9X3BA81_9PSED|nr:PilL N-terminal domain-containing protein [Pseudomonas koreensis]MCU7247280.1 PilL N-terminal domain-containing protein [Pseudomonas koreensis]